MRIGIGLGMLVDEPWRPALDRFLRLREEAGLEAVELHLEGALYRAAFGSSGEAEERAIAEEVRPRVAALGVHLPFCGIHPLSPDPRDGRGVLERSIAWAGRIRADYVAFHARGGRAGDPHAWIPLVSSLAARAREAGVAFGLENADDLSPMDAMGKVLESGRGAVRCCLDLGHLFERAYPASRLARAALRVNDLLSPFPFLVRRGLPLGIHRTWEEALRSVAADIACLHLHNHDGRRAHRPLSRGKIGLRGLKAFREDLKEIPLILEADYRAEGAGEVRSDIDFLREILS